MKPLQTQQKLDAKLDLLAIKIFCVSITIITILLIATLGIVVFKIVCIYDNNNKNENIMSSQNYNKTNNIKNIYFMDICFNNSDSKSYNSIIRQMDELFAKDYCYDVNTINNFELKCKEIIYNKTFHTFIINSSQIIKYHNYCLKNLNDYGYKISQPCIVFKYINKYLYQRQMFYKFPIILSVEQNFSKHVGCDLIYKNNSKILIHFQVYITNGQCNDIDDIDI